MERRADGMQKGRIAWIDLAKGLGIVLVIFGHSVTYGLYGNIARGVIFSFHMPLFFILSSMTFRCSESMEQFAAKTKKAARHLLMPVLAVVLFIIAMSIYYDHSLAGNAAFWKTKLYSVIVASGVPETYYDMEVPALGIPWFFFALFLGRTLFDYLHLNYSRTTLGVLCWMISALGILLGNNQYLPFSIDIAMATLPFFLVGNEMKRADLSAKAGLKLLAFGLVWILTLMITYPNIYNWTYLELSCRRYPLYPICFLTAIAGTLVICESSVLLMKLGKLVRPLMYIGKNSMYLLLAHCVDGYWYRWWAAPEHQFLEAGQRVIADIVVFAIIMLVKTLAGFVAKKRN